MAVKKGPLKMAFGPLLEQKQKCIATIPPNKTETLIDLMHNLLRGHYLEQLLHCERLVGKENVLVLCSEHFFANPQQHLHKIADFTGIDRWLINSHVHKNKTKHIKCSADFINRLENYYAPLNDALFSHLGYELPWGQNA